jgi:anti-sigma B factor antagonist
MADERKRIEVQQVDGAAVVRFVDRKILDETNIQEIGQELFDLVDEEGHRHLVLNFDNVEYLSSAALGKLITLNKKVKAVDGRLKLCAIKPPILEVFVITKLNKLFDIYETQGAALESF